VVASGALTRPVLRIRRRTVRRLALRLVVLALVLGTWQAVGNETFRFAVPTFTATFAAFFEMVGDGSLVAGLLLSNQAMIVGFLLAVLLATPLGVAMGRNVHVDRIASPYLAILIAIPMITILPIVQAIFGLDYGARVIYVFLGSFVYLALNTAAGVRTVEPELVEMATSFGAPRRLMFRHVVLPGAVPSIMAGVRIGLTRAIVAMVLAELVFAGAGVGNLLLQYRARFESAHVLAIALTLVLEGVIVTALARRVEQRAARWRGGAV
jgi:NitT/TauT family transport system permease protein